MTQQHELERNVTQTARAYAKASKRGRANTEYALYQEALAKAAAYRVQQKEAARG
jgi:hypothetical protein